MAVSRPHQDNDTHHGERHDHENGAGQEHAGKRQPTGNEQYFAANPQSADVRRERKVTLRGYDATVQTSNGVFSGNRVDLGTSVLLRHAPMPPQHGTGLDLGCGWGPIALALGFESPDLDIWAVDINERAVDLTAENAKSNGLNHVHAVTAESVPADLTFDVIWSNPPIRIGKEALHELLMAWLPRLNQGGAAYLVVQKNLGSDSLITWLAQALTDGYAVSKYASSKGYRVIEVLRQA
jgi:16S rRNA G1207 methylase RsmC